MQWAVVLLAGLTAVVTMLGRDGRADDLRPVPFVGCPSDGQMGHQPPPRPSATPKVPEVYAARLAYYRAQDGEGVLAPRGWRCFGLYGSNGSSVIVTPERHGGRELLEGRPVIKGSAVEFYGMSSETSGRDDVAQVAARFFPTAREFVRSVAAGWGPEAARPIPMTKADRITGRAAQRVDFVTAAGQQGLGTRGRMAPSRAPVRGAFVIDGEGLRTVHTRLGPADADLAPVIIGEVAGHARPGMPKPQ